MVTITDVAAKAGVSRATVSYVLNGRDTAVKISEHTRDRVLETAAEMGYRRNELARAVITGVNRMLGFWVMQSTREPVVRVLSGAMKEADANNYFIKMLGFDNRSLDERTLVRCAEWRLSGIIAIHAPECTLSTLMPEIRQMGIPFITVDSQNPPLGCTNLIADSATGMREVVEHLIQLGHRRIAFLGGHIGMEDSISGERENAYLETMTAHGLRAECLIEYGDWRTETREWENSGTAHAVASLLNRQARPTAIACASDHLAMITIHLAARRGLRVPEDLSVTGFDNLAAASLYNPPLTTVAQPFEALGRAAVRHLLKLEDQTATQFSTNLIVRGSTSAPSGN